MKQKIKKAILQLKIKLKCKNSKLQIGERTFISSKARIIMEDNAELIIGNDVYVSDNTRLIVHKDSKLILEDQVYVSINSLITSNSEVKISKNTLIAHNVTIIDTNKNYDNPNILIRKQGSCSKEIFIGEDCWLATGVVILPGVQLGNHCIIAANSVVNKNYEDNLIIGGIPSKIIKEIGL